MSQRTQVHGRQSSNCHGADRIEERVDVGYLDFAITCIKDSWEYQGGKGTDLLLDISWD